MSNAAGPDAELALRLFLHSPHLLGGMVLRGDGPGRDAMLAILAANLHFRKIPANVDHERLLGGLDLTATLAAGRAVMRDGILADAAGGAVIVPMAERIGAGTAAHIAQAMDGGALAAVLLDDGLEPDEAPPAVLTERAAFHCDTTKLRECALLASGGPLPLSEVEPLSDAQQKAIVETSAALGIVSIRPLLFAQSAARAHAALFERKSVQEDDIVAAIRLVIAPRATRLPEQLPPEQAAEPETPHPDDPEHESDQPQVEDMELADILLEAATAAIPKHVLDQIERGKGRARNGQSGKAGERQRSAARGRPLGARPGIPGQGKRLALLDTLRAAAPWQTIRRQSAPPDDRRIVQIRKSDLRVRAFEQRAESLTIFAVDASGSSALSRLAEAKGAVELMLAEAYVKRSQVALIAFRQTAAEILLPPTRSLTRARRALAALPGGGGTPLAAGLLASRQLAEAAAKKGQTPTLALLTDGKGNVALDGSAARETAMAEATAAAKAMAAQGLRNIVIDISPRPRAEAAELASAMGGRYLPLPQAHSAAMVAAIESL
jgi:magnesium chelatase subunit D